MERFLTSSLQFVECLMQMQHLHKPAQNVKQIPANL